MPQKPDWDGQDRRAPSNDTIIKLVHETINDIVTPRLDDIQESVNSRVENLQASVTTKIDTALVEFKEILKGHVTETFPEGPLLKHKEYHENKVKAAKTAEQLKADLMGWVIKGGIAVIFLLISVGAIEMLKRELAK